jgi:hypothetical protein
MHYQYIRTTLTFRFSLLFSREGSFSHIGELYITALDVTLDMDSEVSSMREFCLNTLVMH